MPIFTIGLIVVIWSIFGHDESIEIGVVIVIMVLTILTIFYLIRFLQDYKHIEKDKGYRRFGKNNQVNHKIHYWILHKDGYHFCGICDKRK